MSNVVVANTEKVSSTFGICASTRKIIISNPVSGNVAPFLTLSPKKVEKYILRKGKGYSRAIAPHCRAAFSYNDLSSNHKEWIDDKNMKIGELPKGWDVEQALQPMSLHEVRKSGTIKYDDVSCRRYKQNTGKQRRFIQQREWKRWQRRVMQNQIKAT